MPECNFSCWFLKAPHGNPICFSKRSSYILQYMYPDSRFSLVERMVWWRLLLHLIIFSYASDSISFYFAPTIRLVAQRIFVSMSSGTRSVKFPFSLECIHLFSLHHWNDRLEMWSFFFLCKYSSCIWRFSSLFDYHKGRVYTKRWYRLKLGPASDGWFTVSFQFGRCFLGRKDVPEGRMSVMETHLLESLHCWTVDAEDFSIFVLVMEERLFVLRVIWFLCIVSPYCGLHPVILSPACVKTYIVRVTFQM